MLEGLGQSLDALGKDQQRLTAREKAMRVFGHSHYLATLGEERRDEGDRLRPLFDHRAHQARRVRLEKDRDRDDQTIEWDLARMVRHDEHPARWDVLDARNDGAEI